LIKRTGISRNIIDETSTIRFVSFFYLPIFVGKLSEGFDDPGFSSRKRKNNAILE
jgi:hypothetical protein